MDYIITALLLILILGSMFLMANYIGLIGKPISFRKKHVKDCDTLPDNLMKEYGDIDYDKLRKAMTVKRFAAAFVTTTPGDLVSSANVYDYTPEQLITMAKKYGMNLDHYKK